MNHTEFSDTSRARRRRVAGLVCAALTATALPFLAAPEAGAAAGEVLILDSTVTGGAGSTLAQKFTLAGKTPVVVDGPTWSAMTAADFDAYDAIVLGDPTCAALGPEAPASTNAPTWSSVVDGNVVIIGTDETFHETQGGADLMEKAAAFSVAEAGKTGAYISLSCYYHDTAALTPVPLLDGLGTFTATGVGCYNDAHITATHPALTGLTDATLSNWSCSVHEGFDTWPTSFEVLAIAKDIGSAYTAPDGTVGTPYILARGVQVISDIDLAPATATKNVGQTHTVSATVTTDDPVPGTPIVGTTVSFEVIAGPHVGIMGTAPTDAAGVATFDYVGTTTGEDTIHATFVDANGLTQTSNKVTATWEVAPGPTCNGIPATIVGTEKSEVIHGTKGNDVIVALGGHDNVFGGKGDDLICAGDGADKVEGQNGNDVVFGGNGPDKLIGGLGNDELYGEAGKDALVGGPGNNLLVQ